MIVIYNPNLNPYFNLASEQFFLEGVDDVFLIWRNARSVIIGKNQNAFGEVDLNFTKENGIKVARRLTGGGAVFHDEGNINYTFITDAKSDSIDFAKFTAPICTALSQFGVDACLNGRNDLTADGMKISGNAQCVYDTADGRKRLLHHGTLLFSADISYMAGALKVNEEKLKSKGIKSVPSRVKNIKSIDGYCGPDTPEDFALSLIRFAENLFSVKSRGITDEEKAKIEKLRDEKFSRWEWNFGSSPEYSRNNSKRFPYGTVETGVETKNGIIGKISISGDFFGVSDIGELCERLVGVRLCADDLMSVLSNVDRYISGACPKDITDLLLE